MNQSYDASIVQASEASFFAKVYQWMAVGLGVTAISAFLLLANPQILIAIVQNQILFWGIMIGELCLVIWVSSRIMSMSKGKALAIYCTYSALNGIVFALIFLVYTGVSIVSTFAITAGTFIVFSVYGYATKRDLTSIGGLLTMALIGLIIGSIVNIFLQSPVMYWLITYAGIAIFIGLIAWQTQNLKRLHESGMAHGEAGDKLAILGALNLYISFINLFLFLLRIFGDRR